MNPADLNERDLLTLLRTGKHIVLPLGIKAHVETLLPRLPPPQLGFQYEDQLNYVGPVMDLARVVLRYAGGRNQQQSEQVVSDFVAQLGGPLPFVDGNGMPLALPLTGRALQRDAIPDDRHPPQDLYERRAQLQQEYVVASLESTPFLTPLLEGSSLPHSSPGHLT